MCRSEGKLASFLFEGWQRLQLEERHENTRLKEMRGRGRGKYTPKKKEEKEDNYENRDGGKKSSSSSLEGGTTFWLNLRNHVTSSFCETEDFFLKKDNCDRGCGGRRGKN